LQPWPGIAVGSTIAVVLVCSWLVPSLINGGSEVLVHNPTGT
jgi:hypothetical protein